MSLILVLALLAHARNPPQAAQKDTGRVEGVVVDANNKPIKDASVYADNLSMPKPAHPHTAQTDVQRHFVVDEVYPGDIVMRAFKEADKYADITGTWQEPIGETNPELQMKAGDEFKGVVIRLGQKAGSLRWRVFHAGTDEPIKGVEFEMCRGDHPSDRRYCIYGSARGDRTWLVPALAPISLDVSAPNYTEWTYRNDTQKSSPYLELAPGESEHSR